MWTPSLFRPPDGRLHLFYTESRGCWWCESPQCFKQHCKAGAANCDVTIPFGDTKLNLAKLSKDAARRSLLARFYALPGTPLPCLLLARETARLSLPSTPKRWLTPFSAAKALIAAM